MPTLGEPVIEVVGQISSGPAPGTVLHLKFASLPLFEYLCFFNLSQINIVDRLITDRRNMVQIQLVGQMLLTARGAFLKDKCKFQKCVIKKMLGNCC